MSRDPVVNAVNQSVLRLKAQASVQDGALQPNEIILRSYPGLPQPYADVASHQKLLEAVKEALETLLRARGEVEQSAVTLGELERLGIVRVLPNGIVTSPIWDAVRELQQAP